MKRAEPLPGWQGRFWHSDAMTFGHYDVTADCSIHPHHHPHEEVWLVVEGCFEITIEDETRVAGPGFVAVVPPNAIHSVRVLEDGRALVANHPARHDFA